jgi:hypothetical protein
MAISTDGIDLNGFEGDTPPDRKNCRIYVNEDGLLVLDQEPLRRRAHDTHPLIWRLPMSQPFIFPDDNAIVMSGDPLPPDFEGRVFGAEKKVFLCFYTRTGPAVWKYAIRVVNSQTSAELTTLDPTVHQQ